MSEREKQTAWLSGSLASTPDSRLWQRSPHLIFVTAPLRHPWITFKVIPPCDIWVVMTVPIESQPCLGRQLVLFSFRPSVTVGALHRFLASPSLVQMPLPECDLPRYPFQLGNVNSTDCLWLEKLGLPSPSSVCLYCFLTVCPGHVTYILSLTVVICAVGLIPLSCPSRI